MLCFYDYLDQHGRRFPHGQVVEVPVGKHHWGSLAWCIICLVALLLIGWLIALTVLSVSPGKTPFIIIIIIIIMGIYSAPLYSENRTMVQ